MAGMRALREWLGLRPKGGRLPDFVTVGRHSYGVNASTFVRPSAAAPISIGNFCSVGPEVLIFGQADHPTSLPSTYPFRSLLLQPDAAGCDERGCCCPSIDQPSVAVRPRRFASFRAVWLAAFPWLGLSSRAL